MGTNTQYLNTSIRRQYSKTGQTRFSKYPKTSIRILVQILVSGGCQTGPKDADLPIGSSSDAFTALSS